MFPLRFLALATDYDGTLATDGVVSGEVVDALERLVASGRKLILVTGRELEDLERAFPRVDLFHRVVAENGALLYHPATRDERPLAEPPPKAFVQELRARGVHPLSVGRSIVATWEPNETIVLEVIRALGLEMEVVFNKGAVMVLPAGVNKGTGLAAALDDLDLSPHNTMGVGDAENDHAFLARCECAVAVANALPVVKERADITTRGARGAGVAEIIDRLIADDLRDETAHLRRRDLPIGTRSSDGSTVILPPFGVKVLIAGPSGSGKSTLATGFLEEVAERGYQQCIIDPEGDYAQLTDAISLGTPERVPTLDEALQVLEHPDVQVALNLLGISIEDRPAYFAKTLAGLLPLASRSGRPHWLVVDEAHHVLPAGTEPESVDLLQEVPALLLITIHPERLAAAVLDQVDVLIAVGDAPFETLRAFGEVVGQAVPPLTDRPVAKKPGSGGAEGTADAPMRPGEALVWFRRTDAVPVRIQGVASHVERSRHKRKYAQGDLGEDKSFYFRGPDDRLHLRAQNLTLFAQLADGVDDDTWLYHLHRGDYARWFAEAIKDDDLAAVARQIERQTGLSAAEGRARVRKAIERTYTSSA